MVSNHGRVQAPGAPPPQNQATVEVEWLYRFPLNATLKRSSDLDRFFKTSKRDPFEVGFGLAPRYALDVRVLHPTNGLLALILRELGDLTHAKKGGLPLVKTAVGGESANLSRISVDLFADEIALVRVAAVLEVPFDGDLQSVLARAFGLRSAKRLTTINKVVTTVIQKLSSAPDMLGRSDTVTAMNIGLPLADTEFRKVSLQNRRSLVATHIGVIDSDGIDSLLVDELVRNCGSLNLKSPTEYMLANAQGLTYMRPTRAHYSPYPNRFERAADLLSIASYCQGLLLDFSRRETTDFVHWAKQVDRVRKWIAFPENALYASVSNRVLWERFTKSFGLTSLSEELSGLFNESGGER